MPMRGPRATSVGWLALGFILLTLLVPGSTLALSTGHSVGGGAVGLPAPAVGRSVLPVSLAPANAGRSLGAVPASQSIGLGIELQPSSPSALNQLIAEQQTPGSPEYQRFLTPQQYHTQFDPSPSLVSAVQRYFAGYGFSWTPSGPGTYELMGTVGAADRAFHTTLVSYATADGRHAWAPSEAPTLPAELAPVVGSVAGLNTFGQPHPDFLVPPIRSPVVAAPPAPATSTLKVGASPRATVTLTFTSIFFSLYGGTTPLFVPPVGMNVSITATATPPTGSGNCTWSWTLGDGTTNSTTVTNDKAGCASNTVTHEYLVPFNQFYPTSPQAIIVDYTDTAGNAGTYNATVVPSMSTQWMQRFYGEIQMLNHGSSGAGTVIGLNEMCDPTYDNGTSLYTSETNAFSAIMGLTALSVQYVGQGSTYCYPQWGIAGWAGETLLDMEWAHAMAPNATLQVYFGVDGNNMPWMNYMDIDGGDVLWANNLNDGVYVASNSWGIDESTGAYSLYHQTWAQAAAEGLSLFSSTGDCGSTDGTPALNVSWPASDPDGVAVGGTIQQMNHEGVFVNEYVWNGTYSTTTCSNNEGTGGGWSRVFQAPVFQSGMPGNDRGWAQPPVPPWPIKDPRGLPDVSADAATWAAVYFSHEWIPEGGTSLASPMWAAMADVMLDAIGYGQRPAGLIDSHIYAIGVTNVTYARDFHDVTQGSNCNVGGSGCSAYSATTLWDPASGWGSPDVANLTQNWNSTFPPWYQVSGYVLSSTGGVVAGASVSNGAALSVTNAAGYYLLYAPSGSLSLTASAAGYATATRGVLVNTTDLSDVNITLYPGTSYMVSGTVITETGVPVTNAVVTAYKSGTTPSGSAGTNGNGIFTLWLLNGAYTLTAVAPYLNSSSISVQVTGPTTGLTIQMNYIRETVQGLVLSYLGNVPVWGANVIGSILEGTTTVLSNFTTGSTGEFFLHLPEGDGTLSGSVYPYLPATEQLHVWQSGAHGLVLYLTPDGSRTTQVNVALKVIDPVKTPQGTPTLMSGSSLTIEVWANNSLTLKPQLGIYLFPTDLVVNGVHLGTFSSSNVSVSLGGPGQPPAGVAFLNFSAGFLTSSYLDTIVVSVGNVGWTGDAMTSVYLIPNFASTCATSACLYPIWGVVVSSAGARLPGAQVTIEATCGGAAVQTTTTGSSGVYYASLANATYYAIPSAAGYQTASCTQFVVNGSSEEVDLVLEPVKPTLTPSEQQAYSGYHNLITVSGWVIVPLLAIAMFLITVVAFRLMHKGPEEDDEKESKPGGPGGAPAAPTAEQQIFPGGEAPAGLPGPGAPPASAPPSEAPPPETPWEITPAPAPPPPDTGAPPLPDSSGDMGGMGDMGMPESGTGEGPPPLP